MSKLKTKDILDNTLDLGLKQAKAMGIDVAQDDFTVVQSLSNGQYIQVSVEDVDGVRTTNMHVSDALVLLPTIEGTLDAFQGGKTKMSKLETNKIMSQTHDLGVEKAKEMGIDIKKDEYTIVQPLSDGQYIQVAVTEEEGKRCVKVTVSDTLVLLPPIKGTLDVFEGGE